MRRCYAYRVRDLGSERFWLKSTPNNTVSSTSRKRQEIAAVQSLLSYIRLGHLVG